MTGEMTKSEVTRENFPTYFAAADAIDGATVEPFDQYQGPYILVPSKGRYFLDIEGDVGRWWSERYDELSEEFDCDDDKPIISLSLVDLVKFGGTPVERNDETPGDRP